MSEEKISKRLLLPVLVGFFISGYSDIVAPLTGNIIVDLFPREVIGRVNFLPSMAFLWFLVLAVPIAAFMNRRGRKMAARIGFALSFVGLVVAFAAAFGPSLTGLFIGFGILGLGNTFIQMAMNPLLAVISPKDRMTAYLTVGQIVRNGTLLLVGPLALLFGAWTGAWQWTLAVYALVALAGNVWFVFVDLPEQRDEHPMGFAACFGLLRKRMVWISTLGIGAFIVADVGINFVGGQLIETDHSILSSTGFYAFRIIGTIVGYFVLTHYSDVKYLRYNMLAALVVVACMLFTRDADWIYVAMCAMGFLISCVFATFFAAATKAVAVRESNGVAGLMVFAISAGAITCPVCGGLIAWGGSMTWGLVFPLVALGYMLWASWQLKVEN